MRDGEYVGTLISKDCTKDDIINMMVGRVVYEDPKEVSNVPEAVSYTHLDVYKRQGQSRSEAVLREC